MTLKINRILEVVEVHVRAKFHPAVCNGSRVIVSTIFALSRNCEKSENPVLWPWPLTYDLDIHWVSCGCRGARSWKISIELSASVNKLSCIQRNKTPSKTVYIYLYSPRWAANST